MKSPRRPFVEYDGRYYLVVNFDLEPTDHRPSLLDLLADLLAHQDPGVVLLLRPLTKDETALLQEYQRDLEVEAWAQMIVEHEDRFRGRKNEA